MVLSSQGYIPAALLSGKEPWYSLDGRLDEPRGGPEKKPFPDRFQLLLLLCSTPFKMMNSNFQNFAVLCCRFILPNTYVSQWTKLDIAIS
jgi:hypothetical protein